jgi:hypothetical protein
MMYGSMNVNVLSSFFGSFSASFLYSLLDIPLKFLFLFGVTESRLYAGQQNGRFIFVEGRKISLFPTKFRPLCGLSGLISKSYRGLLVKDRSHMI